MHIPKVHYVLKFADNIFRHLINFSAQAEAATSHVRCPIAILKLRNHYPVGSSSAFSIRPRGTERKNMGSRHFFFLKFPHRDKPPCRAEGQMFSGKDNVE
jgi:hypothetical protein